MFKIKLQLNINLIKVRINNFKDFIINSKVICQNAKAFQNLIIFTMHVANLRQFKSS